MAIIHFSAKDVRIGQLMMEWYRLREVSIPHFENSLEAFNERMGPALEGLEHSPACHLDLFSGISGDMYSKVWMAIGDQWKFLSGRIEAIERELRELTGKSADELDAEGLDFLEAERSSLDL